MGYMTRSLDGIPDDPQLFRGTVAYTTRLSPTFQRVTVRSTEMLDFRWLGLDHWFRLFIPRTGQGPEAFELPGIHGRDWWKKLQKFPADEYPYISNYTVADFRIVESPAAPGTPAERYAEMDIDVVLHPDERGDFSAPVSAWATSCIAGTPIAILDQGLLFLPPEDTEEYVIAVDDTGLPAARQIVADLPESARGRILVEVAHAADIESWERPAGLSLTWLPRDDHMIHPGSLALAEMQKIDAVGPGAYGFVVGESKLATGGRRALVAAGLGKDRITFSGFWRLD